MAEDILEEKVITLRKPIENGKETITQIILREPTVDELDRAALVQGMKSNIMLVSFITGVAPSAIGKMGIRDMTEATEYLGLFTDPAPKTGA